MSPRPNLPESLDHELLNLAWDVTRAAGDVLMAGRHDLLRVSTKSTRTDVVTQMDTQSEAAIVAAILGARPEDGILGEEGSSRAGTSGVRWVIDPLDGTVNYLYGQPSWAVSVAVTVAGRAEVGIVDVPIFGETFVAVRGKGAYVVTSTGARSLRVNEPSDLGQALVATGFGYDSARRAAQARTLTSILPIVRDIRRCGAAAVDLCWLAAGRVDAYYERGLQPWDHAAGALIAEEAGAVVGGWDALPPSEELVWAAPSGLAAQFLALLTSAGAGLDG